MAKYKKEVVVFILAIFLLSAIVYASSNESNKRRSILERLLYYQNTMLVWNREEVLEKVPETKKIPVLMYHDISYSQNCVTITPELFEEHMQFLQEEGYTAISIQELLAFVKEDGTLPEKPILITFDDGYESNYTIAYPLLEKYNMRATIFIIGSSVGHKEYYKDTKYPLTPHFSYEEALEMEESGIIEIEYHTYDMHQCADYETGDVIRTRAVKLENESDASFRKAMKKDLRTFQSELKKYLHKEAVAFAYPYGVYDDLSNEIIKELGIQVTFSTEEAINEVTQGDEDCLQCMNRFNMNDGVTVEALREILENQ